jgi:NAD(P)-dependent dehydrogenase (short-subunit alcohol dehydrogenase family)
MTIPLNLHGQVAIVTGASSGLGYHFAQTLAAAGAKVAVAARRTDSLSDLVRKISAEDGRAIPIRLDVTDPQSISACIETAETELGPITILVNNAGIAVTKPALEIEQDEWNRVIDTNLNGVWHMAQQVARHMVRLGHGGSIINIASVLGERATGYVAGYCASKAAVINLTRALSIELARYDIRVNALAPGYIETDINREFLHGEAGEALKKRIPQRRFGQVQDLDGALLLLASEASRYITGSVITVDGGQSAAV